MNSHRLALLAGLGVRKVCLDEFVVHVLKVVRSVAVPAVGRVGGGVAET